MRTINNMLQAVSKIDIQYEIENALIETQDEYVDLQKDQLLHGLKSDGTPIGKYKNAAYAAKKNEMNPLAGLGNVDLRLTGAFQDAIFTDPREKEMIVDSADSKSGALQEKYGENVFGLEPKRKAAFVNELRPVFIENITEKINVQ